MGDRADIEDHRFDAPAVRTVADAVDGRRMSELQESLDRAVEAVRALNTEHNTLAASWKQALIAVVDTLVEIAAVLPPPDTVPKEPDA